jgi:hypothetical protein
MSPFPSIFLKIQISISNNFDLLFNVKAFNLTGHIRENFDIMM